MMTPSANVVNWSDREVSTGYSALEGEEPDVGGNDGVSFEVSTSFDRSRSWGSCRRNSKLRLRSTTDGSWGWWVIEGERAHFGQTLVGIVGLRSGCWVGVAQSPFEVRSVRGVWWACGYVCGCGCA